MSFLHKVSGGQGGLAVGGINDVALRAVVNACVARPDVLVDRIRDKGLRFPVPADDEKLLAQFRNVPQNISFATLQNAMREALRLYEAIDGFQPDPAARVAVWHGAKEPNMKTALKKLRRAWPSLEDHPFPGYGHGEIMANPELMAEEIQKFMGTDL